MKLEDEFAERLTKKRHSRAAPSGMENTYISDFPPTQYMSVQASRHSRCSREYPTHIPPKAALPVPVPVTSKRAYSWLTVTRAILMNLVLLFTCLFLAWTGVYCFVFLLFLMIGAELMVHRAPLCHTHDQ